ncbi:MAG: UvrD-helicase domain-containing protein [Candidatus Azobacteroides sp.]|nr:UvrD-helicase domain-containing protein [Candidatus Azobacteroides sp.]
MLTVYRASAGSGKTFKLTGEYLKLLFQNPASYRHILAVTFTNKATDEMKKRIIEELNILACGEKHSDYTDTLIKETKINEFDIQNTAKSILISILHDYAAFQISTIDRFFQQTMRAFMREIGLQGGYNIEPDADKVLSEAVDTMLSELDANDNKQLLNWLLRYSEDKVENGKSWNIRNDIQELSKEVFKENYKAFGDEIQTYISDKTTMSAYIKKLNIIKKEFESSIKEIGEKATGIILHHRLEISDFKGGSRSPFTHFEKWKTGEIKYPSDPFVNLADNIDSWTTNKTSSEKKAQIENAFHSGLNDCVKNALTLFDAPFVNYQTAVEINRYFYTLGILGDIDKHIRQYAAENNIMLLSDTTQLLNLIIGDCDTPFIYEKTGIRVQHYMIDEFQDTSGMQWKNFYPLIKDSLAAGNFDLIVGDVKQSIYRWRNSDWKLLDEQLKTDFETEGIREEILDTNYRSFRNVIQFNNAFFTLSSHVLQDKFNEETGMPADRDSSGIASKIKQVYARLYQKVPEKTRDKAGHVQINFIDIEEDDDWQARSLENLPSVIEQLQDNGFKLKDIAILVRTKSEGSSVADYLLQYAAAHPAGNYSYDVISDEALFISKSRSVKLLISILRYLIHPNDCINQALVAYEYGMVKKHEQPGEVLTEYFRVNKARNNIRPELYFPPEIMQELERLKQLSLYETTDGLIALFFSEGENAGNEAGETVFLQAFQDLVLDFSTRNTPDISAFLSWWDESGIGKSISGPDEQNAVRILTVHKSKGLGFKAVIMPFCDWEIDHKAFLSNILWLHTDVKPFCEIPLLPVRYSKNLQNTIFKDDYLSEKMRAYIDNLNLAYVAFTRAKEELILTAPKRKKNTVGTIADLLYFCVTNSSDYSSFTPEGYEIISLSADWNEDELKYECGSRHQTAPEKPVSVLQEKIQRFSSVDIKDRLRLRLYGKGFFNEEEQRKHGNLMHEILSGVYSKKDLRKAVQKQILSGAVSGEAAGNIFEILNRAVSLPETADWFSGKYRVLNETAILQSKGKFRRPDRVMMNDDEIIVIDYKFGEKEQKTYEGQVRNYMKLIEKMGYPQQIKGVVWYVETGEMKEVIRG